MNFFNHVTLLSGVAVLLVQQLLKFNFIPIAFANRYPVPTNIAFSVIAAVIAAWQGGIHPRSWTDWVGVVTVIAATAAVVYNQLLSRWSQLKASEGDGKA